MPSGVLPARLQAFFLTLVLMFAFPINALASQLDGEKISFFSLEEIQLSEKKQLSPLEFIKASDGISLAFRAYRTRDVKAVLIFYHGAGAHSGLLYNHIGVGLGENFQIEVYMPDIRGHGSSEGERGDAPTTALVLDDITTLINHVRSLHPTKPIFLGGHSAGAGLVLNYSSWSKHEAVAGYALVAPYLGFRSKTSRESDKGEYRFSEVNVAKFIANSITGGLLFSHSKAVEFNFPEHILEKNPEIVTFNTVTMSNAVTPESPSSQLYQLKRFGLWIGSEDEAFDPGKVIAFAKDNTHQDAYSEIDVLNGDTHFSIVLKSADLIGSWILRTIE